MPSGLDDNEDDTDYEEVLSGFINSHYFLSSARSEADSTSLCSKESEVCDTVLYASILFVGKWLWFYFFFLILFCLILQWLVWTTESQFGS